MAERPRQRATVRDVAAATGVSIATVSRVLNGRSNVAASTRALVLRAVEGLGEQAPGPRGSVPRSPAGAVYLRCPYVLSDYFGLIVSSVAETLELHGLQLVLNAGEASQGSQVLSELATKPGIGSAILILPPEPSQDLETLRRRGFPFVVIDPRTKLPRDIASVSAAHFAGARDLSHHLVELGHRRIGVIAGPSNWLASKGRLAGHASALAEVGVLPAPSLIRHGEPTIDYGYKAAHELLDTHDGPTALVGFNDKAAVGALHAAAERGLRVPDDLSITGFDDIDLARSTRPLLTTVRQPLEEMGRMAVTLLMRLRAKHRVEALHIELGTELIVRGSTGPVRAANARKR